MPYYEVEVTCSKCVCIKADNESDAKEKAEGEIGGWWNQCEADINDEYDENDPKEMEFVEDYKRQGEYWEE